MNKPSISTEAHFERRDDFLVYVEVVTTHDEAIWSQRKPDLFEALAKRYFDGMSSNYEVRQSEYGPVFGRKAKAIEADAEAKEDAAALQAEAMRALKANIRDVVLLDIVMPDGKKLRQATGAECRRAGGFYAEIAKHIKATQVVDKHLTEADLQNIRARFYRGKEAA